MLCCTGVLILLFILYKLFDWLIRLPKIGNYGDRYILVTGCDTGFGHLLAKRLDGLGCNVFAGCFTEKGETELKKACSDRLHAIPLDVSKPESIQKVLEYVKSKLPAERGLWAIMNNAGILGKLGCTEWMSLADYHEVNSVNLLGLIDITMAFLPLIKKERGRVVSTSSIFGRLSLSNCVPYCVSKYGVEAFMDGLRRSLRAFSCKAILIEPGIHRTHMGSEENMVPLYKKCWEEAPPESKEEYGEEFYNFMSGPAREKIMESGSSRISDVVDAYENAILGLFPRARYVVGRDAKLLYLPLIYLPECIGDWIFERLNKDAPLPLALK